MTSTAFDDQFAVCTPEEEEAFRAIEARQREAEDDVIYELMLEAELMRVQALRVYAAIKAGRIPGVVLGGGV